MRILILSSGYKKRDFRSLPSKLSLSPAKVSLWITRGGRQNVRLSTEVLDRDQSDVCVWCWVVAWCLVFLYCLIILLSFWTLCTIIMTWATYCTGTKVSQQLATTKRHKAKIGQCDGIGRYTMASKEEDKFTTPKYFAVTGANAVSALNQFDNWYRIILITITMLVGRR